MKSKTWLILLTFTVVLLLAYSGKVTSGYFSDGESSTNNVLRVKSAPLFGSADSFLILAGSTVTNTGITTVNGDIGCSPGTVSDFPPGTFTGTKHSADADALAAQSAVTIAYNDAAGRTSVIIGNTLGGLTPTPGVYSGGALDLTGDITLNGTANDVWIFQAASSLTTATNSRVILSGTAKAANVYWQVGSSATLGTNSTFKGNILALTTVTLTTGANVEGRVLARNGAVTLDTNIITKPAP